MSFAPQNGLLALLPTEPLGSPSPLLREADRDTVLGRRSATMGGRIGGRVQMYRPTEKNSY